MTNNEPKITLKNWWFHRARMPWWLAALLLLVLVGWGISTALYIRLDGRKFDGWLTYLEPSLTAYLWVGIGGFLTILFLSGVNRRIFYKLGLSQVPEAPVYRPIVTGVIERILFSTVAIFLVSKGQYTALVTLGAAYIGLKGISREEKTDRQIFVSLHSLWWSGVSIAFAVFAGWLFWHIANAGTGNNSS